MARRQRVQGRRRRPALQGPAGPGQGPQDHRRRGRGPAGRRPHRRGRRHARTTGAQRRAGHRLLLASAARPRDRRRAGASPREHALQPRPRARRRRSCSAAASSACEFASVWRSFGAEVTIVEALPRLVAAEDEAVSKALERAFRKRGIDFKRRHAVRVGRAAPTPACGSPSRAARRSRPTCCWSRSAAARPPPDLGYEEQGVAHGPRLRPHRRAAAHQRRRASTPSATSCPACSSPTAASRRASSSPRRSPGSTRPPIDEAGIPRVTYCDPEVASVGLTEATRQGEVRRRRGRDAHLQPRRQRQEPDPQDRRASSSWSAAKDGPVVGVHMVGARVGELIGEAQLIYNWEAYPEDVAAAGPRPPDPERGPRRGAPGAGRQAAARARHDSDPRLTQRSRRTTKERRNAMAASVTMPRTRRERHRRHRHPLAQAGRRPGRGRRAAARGLHRQGRHRDPLAGRRHAARDHGRRGRDRRGRRRARGRSATRASAGGRTPAPSDASRPGSRARPPASRPDAGAGPQDRSRAEPPAAAADARRPQEPAAPPAHQAGAEAARRHVRRRRRAPRSRCPRWASRVTEGTVTRWLKQVGDEVDGRRAAARGLHRQGRHRDPLAGRRHAAGDQGRRGRDRRGRRRAGRDRLRRRRGSGRRRPRRRPRRRRARAGRARAGARARARAGARAGAGSPSRRRRRAGARAGSRPRPPRRARPRRPPARRRRRPPTSPRWSASWPPSTASTCRRVTGTGVGGRIRKQDVLDAAEAAKQAAAEPAGPAPRQPAAAGAGRAAAPAAEPAARHDREDDPAAQGDRQADGRVAAGLGPADHGRRGRRHPIARLRDRAKADFAGPRGREAVVPAVLRAGRGRGAQGAPVGQRRRSTPRRARSPTTTPSTSASRWTPSRACWSR